MKGQIVEGKKVIQIIQIVLSFCFYAPIQVKNLKRHTVIAPFINPFLRIRCLTNLDSGSERFFFPDNDISNSLTQLNLFTDGITVLSDQITSGHL